MEIVFEDEYFLAVNKPTGLVVHADGRTEETSLTDWVKENYPELANIGQPHTLDSGRYTERWGIVNRLDRDTSGLILIAKTDAVFSSLQKQFLDRTIVKEYLAVVWGEVGFAGCKVKDEKRFVVDEPISRHKGDPRIWVAGTGVGERATKRAAETVIEIVGFDIGKRQSLLKLYPVTGRTHQLRLHTRFLGNPIVGDGKYGVQGIANDHGTKQIDKVLQNLSKENLETDKQSRLMLHAHKLKFSHPETGTEIILEAAAPKEFVLK